MAFNTWDQLELDQPVDQRANKQPLGIYIHLIPDIYHGTVRKVKPINKNPANGRHQISQPMLIEAHIKKKNIQGFVFYFGGFS